MNPPTFFSHLPRIHAILATEWRTHEEQIRSTWNALSHEERIRCFQRTPYPLDAALQKGKSSFHDAFLEDWTVENIAAVEPQVFLDLLELRAGRTLYQQSFLPFKHFDSDYDCIKKILSRDNFKLRKELANERMAFFGDKKDGATQDLMPETTGLHMLDYRAGRQVGLRTVSKFCGELIHVRQARFIVHTHFLIRTILEQYSEPQHPIKSSGEIEDAAAMPSPQLEGTASITLNKQPPLARLLLPEVIGQFIQFASFMESSVASLADPRHFSIEVSRYVDNRSDKVPDAQGRKMAKTSAKTIAHAFFDSINDKLITSFMCYYIIELLCALHSDFDNKPFRHSVLQQLSNVFQMAYEHLQYSLRAETQVGIARDCFTRTHKADEKGNVGTIMKDKPDKLATPNTVLHYLLAVLQPETSFQDGIELVNAASNRIISLKELPIKFSNGEQQSLCDISEMTSMMHHLSLLFRMPSFSRKKGAQFVTGMKQAQTKLIRCKSVMETIKLGRNFRRCADSAAVHAAFTELRACTQMCAKGYIADVYKDVLDACLQEIHMAPSTTQQTPQPKIQEEPPRSREIKPPPRAEPPATADNPKAKLEEPAAAPAVDFAAVVVGVATAATQRKKKKVKTKGTPDPLLQVPAPTVQQAKTVERTANGKIKVNTSAAHVFEIIFDKAMSQNSLHWSKFESAMAAIGFGVAYNGGSSVRFDPPACLGLPRPLCVHRPHGCRLDGFWLSRRLKEEYGWDADTFVTR